jgi:hypothetical protein
MYRALTLLFAVMGVTAAQAPAPTSGKPEKKGSISGIIRDAGDGTPIAEAKVSVFTNARVANRTYYMSPATKRVEADSDAKGVYRLSDLPPGVYRISVRMPGRGLRILSKMATLGPGEDLGGIDFDVQATGTIAGRVLDQNKEPVAGATVYLVAKEYSYGAIGYFAKSLGRTDDRGEYRIEGVTAGVPFLLVARKSNEIGTQSEAPADPKRRRSAYVSTYYPSSPEPEGAAPVRIQSRENREGAEILLVRATSFCISGVLEGVAAGAKGKITVAGRELHTGVSPSGGLAMLPPGGPVPADGKFRICDLAPGDYRLMAFLEQEGTAGPPLRLATAFVSLSDRDVGEVPLYATSGIPVAGAVTWAGKPPDAPLAEPITVYLRDVARGMSFRGEPNTSARLSPPGEFSFPAVLPGDYLLHVRVNSPNVYIKDVTYGSESAQFRPIRVGASQGNSDFRVVLAADGGNIEVRVRDKEGKPVPYQHVVILPAGIDSEAEAAARMVADQTDQGGSYSSGVLAPGKYLVLASSVEPDQSVERTSKIWGARSRAKAVEIPPNGTAQVTVEPVL